jgi:hypothetical protein
VKRSPAVPEKPPRINDIEEFKDNPDVRLPALDPLIRLQEFALALNAELSPRIVELQTILNVFVGFDFSRDKEKKREFARMLNLLVSRLGTTLETADGKAGHLIVSCPPRTSGTFQLEVNGPKPRARPVTSTLFPKIHIRHQKKD